LLFNAVFYYEICNLKSEIEMRLFIAIEIPNDVKKAIGEVQSKLKKSGVDASWTRLEGIHLTLKFLGEVAESKVPDIMMAISDVVKGIYGFRIDVSSAGAFPNPKNARVAWMGVSGEIDKLTNLQAAVEGAMIQKGFKREDRVFTPHLTLGRIKYIRFRDAWVKMLEEIKDIKLPTFDVHAVSLIKSDLQSSGAVYTVIGSVELI